MHALFIPITYLYFKSNKKLDFSPTNSVLKISVRAMQTKPQAKLVNNVSKNKSVSDLIPDKIYGLQQLTRIKLYIAFTIINLKDLKQHFIGMSLCRQFNTDKRTNHYFSAQKSFLQQ